MKASSGFRIIGAGPRSENGVWFNLGKLTENREVAVLRVGTISTGTTNTKNYTGWILRETRFSTGIATNRITTEVLCLRARK